MNPSKKIKLRFKSKLRVGDSVQVIAGDYSGQFGTIAQFLKNRTHVELKEIEPFSKYKKQTNDQVKEYLIPIAIHVSNVMAWDKDLAKPSRIGTLFENSQKYRYLKTSGKRFFSVSKTN